MIYLIVSFIIILSSLVVNQKKTIPCANSISCEKSLELLVENDTVGIFQNQHVIAPLIDILREKYDSRVFGIATGSGEKRIYVDLATQKLQAYDGDELYMEAIISSGKWGRTPTGDFTIWSKVRSTRMTGGSGSDYYDLPNVPYVMFFSNAEIAKSRGYGFHGAYWHNNFGHPMSHGCINMRHIDAQQLYEWAEPTPNGKDLGINVTIYNSSQ
jgi:hypothetical protein